MHASHVSQPSDRASTFGRRALSLLLAMSLAALPLAAHAQGVVYSTAPPPPATQQQQAQQQQAQQQQVQQQPGAPPQVVVVQGGAQPQYAGPRVITDYEEGEPVPPGYHPVERVRKGLVVGGAVTFGVLYLLSLLVAAGNTDYAKRNNTNSETDALYIPAIGPFVQMSKGSATANVFLAIDGIAQTAGVIMFVAGIAAPKTVLMRNEALRAPRLMPAPMVGPGMQGMGLVGTF